MNGDALTLTFESAVKTMHQIDLNTWLDKPEHADVKIAKSNYQKIAQ